MFKFSRSGYKALSEVFTNFAAVFLASLVLPVFTGSLDLQTWPVLSLGVILTVIAVFFSTYFANKGKL